jgi:L-ascorbate metabolism protein UlaG (beta-lactamase superfamily)
VSEKVEGLTFYHPGDLQEAFDSQRELRGRIDFMFLPTIKSEGAELSCRFTTDSTPTTSPFR